MEYLDFDLARMTIHRADHLALASERKQRLLCFSICFAVERPKFTLCARLVRPPQNSTRRTVRSADMPRAVWLFTAPRLIPMAEAIWASDRSP